MKPFKAFSKIKLFISSYNNYRHFYRLSADQRNITIYSESGQDWHHFKRIIATLLDKEDKQVCYITSDISDPGMTFSRQNYHSFYIQEGFWQILLFQFLKVDCLILTMIDLHVFQLKRSINPVHYIYLFHAMGSTHMVDFENSYDFYDSILCVGPHQIREIRAREKLKNLPPKNLVEHGYARVEDLMAASKIHHHDFQKPYTILIAPTWGPQSILPVCGLPLVNILLDAGYKVILRPHYQTIRLTPDIVDNIKGAFATNSNFSFVDKMGDMTSLLDSDLLICDWSSTSIEYALGLEKPVLYIDVPRRIRNPHYEELSCEPLEISVRTQVGAIIKPGELDKAPLLVDSLLADPEQFREKLRAFREKTVFNLGKSVEAGAAAIAEIATNVQRVRLQKSSGTT